MTGDFSRNTFDPRKDYSLVRMQQGRLFTDADWNEQGDILREGDRRTAAELIGHAGFPEDDAGFGILPDKSTRTIRITPGTGYVAGVRHVVPEPANITVSRVGGSDGDPTWRIESGPTLAEKDLLSTDPLAQDNFVIIKNVQVDENGTHAFQTTPVLKGTITRLFRHWRLLAQPYGSIKKLPETEGNYLAVLKSTDIPVTALDDPLIGEVAFEGVDTALRDRTIWQVLLIQDSTIQNLLYADPSDTPTLTNGLDPVIGQKEAGKLLAYAEGVPASTDPCTLAPAAGYRSLDNLLYRVEIHAPGNIDHASGTIHNASYKWSRENAIHRTRYNSINAKDLILESTGRDEESTLKSGDWIEIRSQDSINNQTPGYMARIAEVVGKRLRLAELFNPAMESIPPEEDSNINKLPQPGFITRWEGGKPIPITSTPATLENGVKVMFKDGEFQCGDYWLIPARAISGDVEWPSDPSTNLPLAQAPHGPRRDYAALAWLKFDGHEWSLTKDCRQLFPPLTRSKQFLYAGGDGQEATPDIADSTKMVKLPQPLEVLVVRGHLPVAGETVRFTIYESQGCFDGQKTLKTVKIKTGQDGKARVAWYLDSINVSQRVQAEWLDVSDLTTNHSIVFNATLSRAAETSYDPIETPTLAGVYTVQTALERLANQKHFLYAGGDGQEATPTISDPTEMVKLPQPLDVLVVRGHLPVAGDIVRFTILDGKGCFEGQTGLNTVEVKTGQDGKASVEWSLDSSTFSQRVQAEWLDASGPRRSHSIFFNASLSLADQTGYNPQNTPSIADAYTVQTALERLANQKHFLYAGGDGQEATPNISDPTKTVKLPQPLEVVVMNGHLPVAGENIRFEIIQGKGDFGNQQKTIDVPTDTWGKASVGWSLDSSTHVQRAQARRLDQSGQPIHPSITFNATLSRAAETSYDPSRTPAISEARTVQKAIEALAGLQQLGCYSHTISEDSDWVSLLESLSQTVAGEPVRHASICFKQGTYRTSRPVRMEKCGHLRLLAAGTGLVKIIANNAEAALVFADCLSVSLHGLEISAPDGNSAIPSGANRVHRQGVVDISNCPEVDVRECQLSCGGGTSPQRTCLTIRGYNKITGKFSPIASVRVNDNTFHAGNLQDALLVTDAIDIDITGNLFSPNPAGTGSAEIDVWLRDKTWLANITKSLIVNPVKGSTKSPGEFRQIAHGEWRMSFPTAAAMITQDDWNNLVSKNPPTPEDIVDPVSFKNYGDTLIKKVSNNLETPLVSKFNTWWQKFSTSSAASWTPEQQSELRQQMIISDEPKVYRFDAKTTSPKQVVVEANNQFVAFDSLISQADWKVLIERSKKAPSVANADELVKLCYSISNQVLVDSKLNTGLNSIEQLLGTLVDKEIVHPMQAIICAGRTLENVSIKNNIIRDFQVGIRVAPSHERTRGIRAMSVCIDDNRMELLAQHSTAYAGFGMMIGNAKTLRIRGNDMRLSPRAKYTRYFSQGIRIWGFIGEQVLVSENRIQIATLGFRFNCLPAKDDDMQMGGRARLWLFRENLIQDPTGHAKGWKISPSADFIVQNNIVSRNL
ncbi:MAG: DUF6519 domain-containing protein [Cyanobacteriota bacterium]